jgi:hypothetical protein
LVFWQVSEQRVSTLANTLCQAQCCFTLFMKLKRGDPGCTVQESGTCFVYITRAWRPHKYEVRIQNIWTQGVFCYTVTIYWNRQYIVHSFIHSFIHPSLYSFILSLRLRLSFSFPNCDLNLWRFWFITEPTAVALRWFLSIIWYNVQKSLVFRSTFVIAVLNWTQGGGEKIHTHTHIYTIGFLVHFLKCTRYWGWTYIPPFLF